MDEKPVLLFDAGGTLVFPNFEFLRLLLGRQNLPFYSVEQLHYAYYRVIYDFDCAMRQDGKSIGSPWAEDGYARTVLMRLGIDGKYITPISDAWNAQHKARNLWAYSEARIKYALQTMQDAGYRMAVFSNSDGRTRQVFDDVELTSYFERIFDSQVIGLCKPDPAAFAYAANELGVKLCDMYYIGDIYVTDIAGARAAGMQAIHIDPYRLYTGWAGPHVAGVSKLPDYLGVSRHV